MHPEPTTYNILFVCTGNTCRSALAEAIARGGVERLGWQHVAVASAGTSAAVGAPATPEAVAVAAEHGLDLAAHRSQPLTAELVEWADVVLTMAPSHLWTAADLGAGTKAALLTDFVKGDAVGEAVDDPFGGDVQTYRTTYAQLDAAIEAVLERLSAILAP